MKIRVAEGHPIPKAAFTGQHHSETTKKQLADIAWKNYQGGAAGDAFAEVLCPVGFIREHRVYWATELRLSVAQRHVRFFCLDFAHIEGKIDIELDGPAHKTTPKEDWQRDEMLRYLGWKVIRIKHGKDG